MKIGILQTGHVVDPLIDTYGDFDAMFRQLLHGQGFEFQTYNAVDGILPDKPSNADGWLITGSKHGAYEDLPWIPPLEDFLRRAFASDIPIVGICFGHQIMAKALGGEVKKFDGGWSIGNQGYQMVDGTTPRVIAWHQDQVTTLPVEATCIGSSSFCENAFVVYGRRAYTMQAHPEFTTDFGRALADLRRDSLPTNLVREADMTFSLPLDTRVMADQIAEFFRSRTL